MKIFNHYPTPIKFKRKKKNIIFLLNLIKYFFEKGKKPKFDKNILKDQSFFSLIRTTDNIAIAHESLIKYKQYQNSWLHNEVKNYLDFYKKKEESNSKTIKLLNESNKKINITPIILKEYNYKLISKNIKNFIRFSNDIDILIKKSELFRYDNFLRKNNFLLNNIDIEIDFKPSLSIDGNFILNKKIKQGEQLRKRELIKKIEGNEKDLTYIKNPNKNPQIIEVHFYPNNYKYFKNSTPLEIIYKNTYNKDNLKLIKPEARILYDANHFFIHLRFRRTLKNGLNRFLCNLKRICDIEFNLKTQEKINWEKLVFLAKKNNISPHVYGYLMIGKKYLNLDIPQKIINQLKKDSNFLQTKIIDNINVLSVFQDKRDLFTTIYIKKYLMPK